jgi:hypothetical protein
MVSMLDRFVSDKVPALRWFGQRVGDQTDFRVFLPRHIDLPKIPKAQKWPKGVTEGMDAGVAIPSCY